MHRVSAFGLLKFKLPHFLGTLVFLRSVRMFSVFFQLRWLRVCVSVKCFEPCL